MIKYILYVSILKIKTYTKIVIEIYLLNYKQFKFVYKLFSKLLVKQDADKLRQFSINLCHINTSY